MRTERVGVRKRERGRERKIERVEKNIGKAREGVSKTKLRD